LFSPEASGVEARSDASETVRALPQLVRRTVPQRIALVLSVEDNAWVALSAPDLLRILANLVLNARDAIADVGTIGVHVRRGGGNVMLEVSDTGSGMDEETRARLFQPFFTTKPIGRGTGLGLATAKILVERAGGEIKCVSEPGTGTRFTIRVPEIAAPGAVVSTPAAHRAASEDLSAS
jgi:two-component system NtrC family sensor kinase